MYVCVCVAGFITTLPTPTQVAGVHSPAIGVHVENRTEGMRQDLGGTLESRPTRRVALLVVLLLFVVTPL